MMQQMIIKRLISLSYSQLADRRNDIDENKLLMADITTLKVDAIVNAPTALSEEEG